MSKEKLFIYTWHKFKQINKQLIIVITYIVSSSLPFFFLLRANKHFKWPLESSVLLMASLRPITSERNDFGYTKIDNRVTEFTLRSVFWDYSNLGLILNNICFKFSKTTSSFSKKDLKMQNVTLTPMMFYKYFPTQEDVLGRIRYSQLNWEQSYSWHHSGVKNTPLFFLLPLRWHRPCLYSYFIKLDPRHNHILAHTQKKGGRNPDNPKEKHKFWRTSREGLLVEQKHCCSSSTRAAPGWVKGDTIRSFRG